MTGEVIKYIDKVDKSKPFMVVLAYYAVHQPIEAKEADIARNKKEIDAFDYGNQPEYISEGHGKTKMRQDNPQYAGMVENLDLQIGKLLKKLEDLGLEENTMIIFSSDHGGLSNTGSNNRGLATSNYPLRAGKGWIYEGGIKVPLFIKWKGFTPRKDSNSIITLMDVFPTILDFTSDKQVKGIAGKSFMPVLNKKEKWNDRTVFWHATKNRPESTGEYKYSAIRDGDYKLIHFYETDVVELYNIKKDPSEKNDLAITQASKTNVLMSKLTDWKKTF
jgi:arylsulfatase A-like enzyme